MKGEQLQNAGAVRTSAAIKRRPAVNLHHAQRYAEMLGVPMRLFVTINFTLLGIPPAEAVLLFRFILCQRFAPWLRRTCLNKTGLAPTYIWVAEAAGGHLAVHWLLHLPPQLLLQFRGKLSAWLTGAGTTDLHSRALNIKRVTNVVGLRRYMLKGTEPLWAKHLGVRHQPQGIVIGKRSGFSKNLGPTARQGGGYQPRRVPFPPVAA